jgi:hypothetical protein
MQLLILLHSEIQCTVWVSVAVDHLWETVKSYNGLSILRCKFQGVNGLSAGHPAGLFGVVVHTGHNAIVSFQRCWYISNEIYSNTLPVALYNRLWFQHTQYIPSLWMNSHPYVTAFCLSVNFFPHPWPEEILSHYHTCYCCCKMPSHQCFMFLLGYLVP